MAQNFDEASQFVRFQSGTNTWEGELQTAITTYENNSGVIVELVAAIHIADKSYFRALNQHFTTRHAVLYELVAESNQRPQPGAQTTGGSLVSLCSVPWQIFCGWIFNWNRSITHPAIFSMPI
jgi:hypothetical protein